MSYADQVAHVTSTLNAVPTLGALLTADLRPALALDHDPEGQGRTRIGGVPDVPAGFEWPTWEVAGPGWLGDDIGTHRPLSFIGQVDLGAAAQAADGEDLGIDGLPASGLASFFIDRDHHSGLWSSQRRGTRVLIFDEDDLSPASVPDGAVTAPEMVCRLRLFPSLVPLGHVSLDGVTDSDWDALWNVQESLHEVHPLHQFGGWAAPVQNPVEEQAALSVGGVFDMPQPSDVQQRVDDALAAGTDWRLLLQVGSDDRVKMMWGDVGIAYWCVANTERPLTDRLAVEGEPVESWTLTQFH